MVWEKVLIPIATIVPIMFEWSDNRSEEASKTTIEVSMNTYMNINSAKRPSESFDDTLEKLLNKLWRYEKSNCNPEIETKQTIVDPSHDMDDIELAVREAMSKSSFDEERVEAMREIVDYLAEEKRVGKREFQRDLYESNSFDYSSKESWWEHFVRPALKEFEHAKAPPKGGKWEYLHTEE